MYKEGSPVRIVTNITEIIIAEYSWSAVKRILYGDRFRVRAECATQGVLLALLDHTVNLNPAED